MCVPTEGAEIYYNRFDTTNMFYSQYLSVCTNKS